MPTAKTAKWPRSAQLPGGRIVTLRVDGAKERSGGDETGLFADALSLFTSGHVTVLERGAAVDPSTLALAEFHALRAIAMHTGALDEEPVEIECRNCDTPIRACPCASFPLGPFMDAELSDPELDATLDFGVAHSIPAIALGKGRKADTIQFAPVTLGQASALHEALVKSELRVTSAIVRAMGVKALGDERDPRLIARALARCTDAQFAAVTDLFLDAHYPPRLVAPIVCPKCGSRNDVDAPYEREFEPVRAGAGARSEGDTDAEFPSFDAFDAFARELAGPRLSRAPGPEIVLVVESGVAACDDGGEPLMGSYVPGHEGDAHGPSRPPEIALFYRTFASMWREDGPYDWRGEVRETLEHELEHHLFQLEGYDPQDEEEREEIVREAQRVLGKKALVRASASAFASDLGDFWKRTWVFWIVGLIVVVISVLAAR